MTILRDIRDSLSLPVVILRLVAAISRLARAWEAALDPLSRMASSLDDYLKLELLRRGASLETLREEYERVLDLENHPEKAAKEIQDFGRVGGTGDMDLLYAALAAVPAGSFEERELVQAAMAGASPQRIAEIVREHGIRTTPEGQVEQRVQEAGGVEARVRIEDLPNSQVIEAGADAGADDLGGATFGGGERR